MTKLLRDCTNQELLDYIEKYELDFIRYQNEKDIRDTTDVQVIVDSLVMALSDIRVLIGICKELTKRSLLNVPLTEKTE